MENVRRADKARVLVLTIAHTLNDWYMNYIQTLLPFLIASGLAVSRGAFLVSVFTVTSSLVQPFLGYLVDRKDQRWLVYAGTLWMAVLLSLIGVVKHYPLQLIMAMLAGLGTAAFHPQASAMVASLSGGRKGFYQAMFITGGNVGWALTPLMMVPLMLHYGLGITPLAVVPGVLVALLLWLKAPRYAAGGKKSGQVSFLQTMQGAWRELAKITSVVALRALAYFSLVAFLPLYLMEKNVPLITGSRLVFIMLFSGAIGGLVGGHLSDLLGRKKVIVGTLCLSGPLFYSFLLTGGALSVIILIFAGAALMASFSVTVVAAQEVISNNEATASGLILGFGMGVGGLGVGLMGLLVEYFGIIPVMQVLVWFPVLGGLAGLLMRDLPAKKAPVTISTGTGA